MAKKQMLISSTGTVEQGTKYLWRMPSTHEETIRTVAQQHNLSRPIAATLVTRGLIDQQTISTYLSGTREVLVGNAQLLKGALTAVARLQKAIAGKEKMLIFGDYDVDGITSTSLMLVSLLPLGANLNYFLPNRVRDGYGLSVPVVRRAAQNGYRLIITVDNGITAHEAAAEAARLGVDVIITDHHRPHGQLPQALAIVNPQQSDCAYPHKTFAGVGVIFKLMSLLYDVLGKQLPEKAYELLMLGTVADVVPLVNENRFWVQHGLARVNKSRSLAMSTLASNAGLTRERWGSLDVGFMIAPQLNALGRLDDPREAVRFLISAHAEDVEKIGKTLKAMNEERKRVDRIIYEQIEGAIFDRQIDLATEKVIMAAHNDWPTGVIGLVAGKLTHSYGRPTLLFHRGADGIAKGSCRSIPEFSIFDALDANKNLLISFGGHTCAAGLKLEVTNLPQLKERLEQLMADQFSINDLVPKLSVDATLLLPEVTKKLVNDLALLEPFGHQNSQPLFAVRSVTQLKQPTLLKDKHVKTTVFADGIVKPVIFFNRPDLFSMLREHGERPFDLVGHVTVNEWNETTNIELQGLDIALQK